MAALRLIVLCAIALAFGSTTMAAPPAPLPPAPSPAQLAWQRQEKTLFIHFGVNTFTDREWGDGKESPRIFNPTRLDARQWAKAAKAGGFKIMILTAKHHDGFCLWPSKYTEHSVKNSPWKDGKGDVVREFVDACRAEGLKAGLYLSPWDRHEASYGNSPEYNKYYMNQLSELLTNYGEIVEVWFDGACAEGPNGKRQEYDWPAYWGLVRKLQPNAVMFSDAGPDVRWIGNEQGFAGEECWSTVDPSVWVSPGKAADGAREAQKRLHSGDKGGTVWRAGECDVSIRPGWFYHTKENEKVRSVDNLVDLYFKSVGRNSLLLLNVPPTPEGLLHETDVNRLAEFRAKLDDIFRINFARNAKATATHTREGFAASNVIDGDIETYWAADDGTTSASIEIDLGQPVTFGVACMQEHIALGQRVESYRVEYLDGTEWKAATRGTTIGHKKLDRFPPVTAQRVRLVIEKALACPTISNLAIYP